MKRFLITLNLLVLGVIGIETLPINYSVGMLLAMIIWCGWKMT